MSGEERAATRAPRGGVWAAYVATMLMVILALVVVAGLWSRRKGPGCEEPGGCGRGGWIALPALSVRYGDPDPELVVALFVDLESAASRQVFSAVSGVIGVAGLGVRSALWLLHAPSGGCSPGDEEAFGCVAARAVECVEAASKGRGVEMAGLLFDLQWVGAERSPVNLREGEIWGAAQRLAVRVGEVEEPVVIDTIKGCVAEDRVLARVAGQSAWARARGLVAAPAGFVLHRRGVAAFDARLTEASLRRVVRCLVSEGASCEGGRP